MALVRTSKPALAEAVFNAPEPADLRLECLRLALQVGAPDMATLLANAEAFLGFVRPRKATVAPADLFPADIPTVSP